MHTAYRYFCALAIIGFTAAPPILLSQEQAIAEPDLITPAPGQGYDRRTGKYMAQIVDYREDTLDSIDLSKRGADHLDVRFEQASWLSSASSNTSASARLRAFYYSANAGYSGKSSTITGGESVTYHFTYTLPAGRYPYKSKDGSNPTPTGILTSNLKQLHGETNAAKLRNLVQTYGTDYCSGVGRGIIIEAKLTFTHTHSSSSSERLEQLGLTGGALSLAALIAQERRDTNDNVTFTGEFSSNMSGIPSVGLPPTIASPIDTVAKMNALVGEFDAYKAKAVAAIQQAAVTAYYMTPITQIPVVAEKVSVDRGIFDDTPFDTYLEAARKLQYLYRLFEDIGPNPVWLKSDVNPESPRAKYSTLRHDISDARDKMKSVYDDYLNPSSENHSSELKVPTNVGHLLDNARDFPLPVIHLWTGGLGGPQWLRNINDDTTKAATDYVVELVMGFVEFGSNQETVADRIPTLLLVDENGAQSSREVSLVDGTLDDFRARMKHDLEELTTSKLWFNGNAMWDNLADGATKPAGAVAAMGEKALASGKRIAWFGTFIPRMTNGQLNATRYTLTLRNGAQPDAAVISKVNRSYANRIN